MDCSGVSKIESFLMSRDKKEGRVESGVSCILGVVIGLKKACCVGLYGCSERAFEEFTSLLQEVGLSCASFECEDNGERFRECYIAPTFDVAMQLKMDFDRMKEAFGACKESEAALERWSDYTRRIGETLGYPRTATEAFIEREAIHLKTGKFNNDNVVVGSKQYRHFIHSKANLSEELAAYDEPLNAAIREYLPKTARFYGLI